MRRAALAGRGHSGTGCLGGAHAARAQADGYGQRRHEDATLYRIAPEKCGRVILKKIYRTKKSYVQPR